MAKKQTQTTALDASAMFQIGAAGAVSKKQSGRSGESIISQIGRTAIGYYMKAQDNLRASRQQTGNIFAGLEAQAFDADFAMVDIANMKKNLTNANKVLNSVRGMLLPNSDLVTQAQEDRDRVLKNITKLGIEYKNFKEKVAYQHKVNDGLYQVKLDSGEQATAGWGNGNTAMQMYNTSLLINGSLEKALSTKKGELYVSISKIDAPFDGSWDNPLTEKVETKDDFKKAMGDIDLVKLSDMQFATHANPNQAQISKNYISGYIQDGMKGLDMEDNHVERKGVLKNELDKLNEKELVDYLFDENGWMNENDESTSLVQAQIDKIKNDPTNPLFKQFDADNDKILDVDEIEGAKELLKYKILDGTYSTEQVTNMIHDRAIEKYDQNYKTAKRNERKGRNKTAAEIKAGEIRDLLRKASSKNDITLQVLSTGRSAGKQRRLRWFDEKTLSSGKIRRAGYHSVYMGTDGEWKFEDASVEKSGTHYHEPMFYTIDAAKDWINQM